MKPKDLETFKRKLKALSPICWRGRTYRRDGYTGIFSEVIKPIEVYKKVYISNPDFNNNWNPKTQVITLILPVGTIVRGPSIFYKWAYHHKFRANQAWVQKGNGLSGMDNEFMYTEGTMVFPRQNFQLTYAECAAGIHFFLTKPEARHWNLR